MKRMQVEVKVKMSVLLPENTESFYSLAEQVLNEMDYDFESTTPQTHIEKTEIIDFNISE